MNKDDVKIGDKVRYREASVISRSCLMGQEAVVTHISDSNFKAVWPNGEILYHNYKYFELVEIKTKSDEELAEEYREFRKKALEIYDELVSRGYYLLCDGITTGPRKDSRLFKFRKTVTTTKEI